MKPKLIHLARYLIGLMVMKRKGETCFVDERAVVSGEEDVL